MRDRESAPVVKFGRVEEILDVPNLVDLQTRSYSDFLQADVAYGERKNVGLESILREVFPIKSFNGEMALEYVGYELGRPRYTPDECRRLRLTYGAPFKVRVRLEKDDTLTIEAPFGLEDLFAMTLRPNPTRPLARGWDKITRSAQERWPEVTIIQPRE